MVKLSWKCEGTNHFLLVRILLSAYGTSNLISMCFLGGAGGVGNFPDMVAGSKISGGTTSSPWNWLDIVWLATRGEQRFGVFNQSI